jgi:hypothetical protein
MKWKKPIGTILLIYGAASIIATLLAIIMTLNSTVLTFLNPLQTVIADYIQTITGLSIVKIAFVGWGLCWIFLGRAIQLWGKGEK